MVVGFDVYSIKNVLLVLINYDLFNINERIVIVREEIFGLGELIVCSVVVEEEELVIVEEIGGSSGGGGGLGGGVGCV